MPDKFRASRTLQRLLQNAQSSRSVIAYRRPFGLHPVPNVMCFTSPAGQRAAVNRSHASETFRPARSAGARLGGEPCQLGIAYLLTPRVPGYSRRRAKGDEREWPVVRLGTFGHAASTLNLTDSQPRDVVTYEPGQIVEFHRIGSCSRWSSREAL